MSIKFWTAPRSDSTTSLGNLCLCSTTLTVKKIFAYIKWKFLHLNLWPLPLVHSALWTHPGIATGFHLFFRTLLNHKCRIIQAITQMFLCFMSSHSLFGCVISASEGHGVYGARTDFTDWKRSATEVWLFISQHLSPSLSLKFPELPHFKASSQSGSVFEVAVFKFICIFLQNIFRR